MKQKIKKPKCLVGHKNCNFYVNGECGLLTETEELFSKECSFFKTRAQIRDEKKEK